MTLDETSPTTDLQATPTTDRIRQRDGNGGGLCPNCGEWVGLSLKGSKCSFLAHRGSNRGQRAMQRKVL